MVRKRTEMCTFVSLYFLTLLITTPAISGQPCSRNPGDFSTPKRPGDNSYQIDITGQPSFYVPGREYVDVQYKKANLTKKKQLQLTEAQDLWRRVKVDITLRSTPPDSFREFTFACLLMSDETTPAGTFQILDRRLSRFKPECPRILQHASKASKTAVDFRWIAPPAGTGCIAFKASVVQRKQIWFMDEQGLTLWLCEEDINSAPSTGSTGNDDNSEDVDCCACHTAKYTVTMRGLWSRETHPKDFPGGHGDHWSDLIGASHTKDYTIWKYGGYASMGVQRVAEWGSPTTLEREFLAQTRNIKTVIRSRGLWPARGNMSAVFSVNRTHNLVSMLSMIGPSPDWCVGISRVSLCTEDCDWMQYRKIDLFPWDAGTDSGISFRSPNNATIPKEPIHPITSLFPSNPLGAFYDPSGEPIPPMAKLIFERTDRTEYDDQGRVICEVDDGNSRTNTGGGSMPPKEGMMPPKEGMTGSIEGTGMPPKGGVMPPKGGMMNKGGSEDGDTTPMMKKPAPDESVSMPPKVMPNPDLPDIFVTMPPKKGGREPVDCMMTQWGEWTECSRSCGKGTMHRLRMVKRRPHHGGQQCGQRKQKKRCDMGPCPRDCMMTEWGAWQSCSVTCGNNGIQLRMRKVKKKPRGSGQPCSPRKEERVCGSEREC